MSDGDEKELRARYGALRREVAASAPPFATPEVHVVRRRVASWSWAAALAAAAAAGALFLGRGRGPVSGYDLALGSVMWTGPTDFLLALPGDLPPSGGPSSAGEARVRDPAGPERPPHDTLGRTEKGES